MTAFDKFSELDPAKLLREIDDEIDGDVFDQFSILSPERVRQQLADNGIVVSNAAMLDPSRFAGEVETALADEGGGGGGGEVLSPLFDGIAYLLNSALVATNSNLLGFSFWTDGITTNGNSAVFFCEDVEGGRINAFGFSILSSQIEITAEDDPTTGNYADYRYDTSGAVAGVHHVMGALDTTGIVAALYIDDVYIPATRVQSSGAFTAPLNGTPFAIAGVPTGGGFTGMLQHLWINVGDIFLDGSGRIPQATRHKFISGEGTPVDLGADGSTPFGSVPMVYNSGGLTAFQDNQGSGGPFVLVDGDGVTETEVDVSVVLGLPDNTVAPVVSGTAQVGQTLSCTTGTWSGTAPIIYSYQWYSGQADIISGETGSTLLVTPEMDIVGAVVFCRVYATNSLWGNYFKSNDTDPVIPA